MIARTANVALQPPRRRPLETLAEALRLVWRGACAVADDVGWSAWRWYQVHQSVKVLSGLDDRMLEDIGVSRSTILGATLGRVAEEEAIRRRSPW